MRAKQVGDRIRRDKERTIVEGVIDAFNAVYRPHTGATPFYQAGHGNVLGSNALVDYLNLDAADLQLRTVAGLDLMGEPILTNAKILLSPVALSYTAKRIINATEIRNSAEMVIGKNYWQGVKPLSSPYIDPHSTTCWWWGDFKRSFIWHEVWPISVVKAKAGNEDEFERDVFVRFKARYLGGVAAVDHRFVVRSCAAEAS